MADKWRRGAKESSPKAGQHARLRPLRMSWYCKGRSGTEFMTDEIKNPGSRVDRSANGKFHAIWRGQLVYMSGRIKEFEAERDAWEYLARCDAEGRILE